VAHDRRNTAISVRRMIVAANGYATTATRIRKDLLCKPSLFQSVTPVSPACR
jgi:hypothetical protein